MVTMEEDTGSDFSSYIQTYRLTSLLCDRCLSIRDVLFFTAHREVRIGYDDPRLAGVLEELDAYLGDYVPTNNNLASALFSGGDFDGTIQGGQKFRGLDPLSDVPIKNAAFSLRRVIRYAIENEQGFVVC